MTGDRRGAYTSLRGRSEMEVKITINCDNAAFEDAPEQELGRLLMELAQAIQVEPMDYLDGRKIRDINGNTVGSLEVTA